MLWRGGGEGAPSKTLVKSPKVKTLICYESGFTEGRLTLSRMIGCLISVLITIFTTPFFPFFYTHTKNLAAQGGGGGGGARAPSAPPPP